MPWLVPWWNDDYDDDHEYERREDFASALDRAIASGKTACVNVKCRGVISPIVAATSDKRDKASIE